MHVQRVGLREQGMSVDTPVLFSLLLLQKSNVISGPSLVHMHLSCPVECLVQRKSSAISRILAGCLQSKLAHELPLEKLPYSFMVRMFKKSFRTRFPQAEKHHHCSIASDVNLRVLL